MASSSPSPSLNDTWSSLSLSVANKNEEESVGILCLPNLSCTRRMPAEWEPHIACLILYPHNPFVFRSNCRPAQAQVKRLIQSIVHEGQEDVLVFCKTDHDADVVRTELEQKELDGNGGRIWVLTCASDDTWARDTGPTFCVQENDNKQNVLIGLDWEFNAYGGPDDGCYWPCNLDRAIASNMCKALSSQYSSLPITPVKVPMVLEGGSIHTDGEGTLLTTAECLLHCNRNPFMSKDEIEKTILDAVGCTRAIWLPNGLAADEDTNGHVDNMACFVRPGHVALSWSDDQKQDEENYRRCRQALEVLERELDAKGRAIVVHKLHLPPPMYYTRQEVETLAAENGAAAERQVGERLAASYANFYIANSAVIVPQFGHDESDARALDTLRGLFPERKVVPLPSREILLGGGNIHCFTQQVPRLLEGK